MASVRITSSIWPIVRALVITQLFDPEPTLKGRRFVEAIGESGFSVEVITGFPNYPGGRWYDGWQLSPVQLEKNERLTVHRLLTYPSHNRSPLLRIFTYLSFMLVGLPYALLRCKRPDVIYAYSSPVTALTLAVVLGSIWRCPVVGDVQDLWPDTVLASGMTNSGMVQKVATVLSELSYRGATRLVAQSESYCRELEARGHAASKVTVVYNWAQEARLGPPPAPATWSAERPCRIAYVGSMGAVQNLMVLIEAADKLKDDPRVEFEMRGEGTHRESLEREAIRRGLKNVRFESSVPMEALGTVLGGTDILVVSLGQQPPLRWTIPSKFQTSLWSGRPVLFLGSGETASLVNAAQLGWVVEDQDPMAVRDQLLKILDAGPVEVAAKGLRAKEAYESHFSEQRQTAKWMKVLWAVAGGIA